MDSQWDTGLKLWERGALGKNIRVCPLAITTRGTGTFKLEPHAAALQISHQIQLHVLVIYSTDIRWNRTSINGATIITTYLKCLLVFVKCFHDHQNSFKASIQSSIMLIEPVHTGTDVHHQPDMLGVQPLCTKLFMCIKNGCVCMCVCMCMCTCMYMYVYMCTSMCCISMCVGRVSSQWSLS